MTEIKDPLLLEFLSLMKKGTRRTYESYFRRLLEFEPTLNGSQMLKEKGQWERSKCIAFKRFLEQKGYSSNMQKSAIGAIRGFFSHNRKPLFFSMSEKKQVNTAINESEGIFFSKEDMAKMWSISSSASPELFRWVLCNKSMGLRASDFGKITYRQLRALDLNSEIPIFFGQIPTGKENIIANVFLDSDCVHTIAELLELHKTAKDSERVFPHNAEHLSYVLKNLAVKAQINTKGKEVSFHAMRRFLYDRLCSVMSDDKAKLFIGKAIKENSYIDKDPEKLREDFTKVLAEISVNGNNGAVKAKVEKLDNTVENLVRMLSEKDKVIEELKTQLAQNSNTMNKMLSLPTIAREMLKAKEKVQID
jgi:uncharacterized coiled-coil protein SlyX